MSGFFSLALIAKEPGGGGFGSREALLSRRNNVCGAA